MKKQIIVTVGREHGSGGHYIAQLIAEQLHFNLYDKELVEGTTLHSGYSKDIVKKMDEKPINFFTSRRIGGFSNSLEENVAEMTFDFIRRKAESGESFVVVGRCAEQVLTDRSNVVRVFITGENDEKVRRLMETENVDAGKAEDIMKDIDRKRRTYHNYYCDFKWGDSRYYDFVMNSSKLGIQGTADALVFCIRSFMQREN